MSEVDAEIEAVATQAKAKFNLSDRVKNRNLREATVTVYLDEVTGAALGGAEDKKTILGVVTGRERWGVLGEIDAAIAEDPEADVSVLRNQAIALTKTLQESALTLHLRAVPEVAVKSARRHAKKAAGTGADNASEYNEVLYNHLIAACVRKVVDSDGAESDGFDLESAAELQDYLPSAEHNKILAKVNEIQFKQAVSDSVTGSADF